jgi:hypothetical protein
MCSLYSTEIMGGAFPKGDQRLLIHIRHFLLDRNRGLRLPHTISVVDENFAMFCADVHESAEHCPSNLATIATYEALAVETLDQYEALFRVCDLGL